MKVTHILFPTDFSESAERALPHALEVARKFGAKITILHVRTLFAEDPNRPESKYFDEGLYEADVERQLAEMAQNIDAADLVETATVRSLSAASAILEFIEEKGIDFVAMGTHGHSALLHFLLGSVAEKVVRHAPCPVLTVGRFSDDYRNRPQVKKVLAAFDFSGPSKFAVHNAYEFAKLYEAELEILYVIEQLIHPAYFDIWKVAMRKESDEIVASAKESLTEALGDELEDVRLTVQVGDADGKAAKEIVTYARAGDFDLIVMGTKGLSGFHHALLGSTTEKVVRIAPCPVLTFHAQKNGD